MTEILHLGLSEKYLQGIRKHYPKTESVFRVVSPDNIDQFFSQKNQDVLLIGENVTNPIKIAQKAHSSDSCLSILIISEPSHYNELQKKLMLTPFIGNSVKCVSDGNDDYLAETIKELVIKTKQRRNFQVLKKAELSIQTRPNHEQLKEEYLTTFFQNAPLGAVLLDEKDVILAMNRFFLGFFNSSDLDVIGMRFDLIFPDNIQKHINNFVTKGYKKRPTKIFQLSNTCFVEIKISDVQFQDNSTYKTIIINDVTEKTKGEVKLKEYVKELKKINSDLDSFIYTASHDLRAPISNIEGLIYSFKDILQEKTPDRQEMTFLLSMIEKSVLKFKETISYLTEIAKVQKNISEELDEISLQELIDDVLLSIGNMISESESTFNINVSECPKIRFSRRNLQSIFYNLICNAIKYRSNERKPVIEIDCKNKGNKLQICVTDNGLGIPVEKTKQMFSMFKRFHDHVEGTGVGLYLVKRILDNSGGKIKVDSQVGKGTTFTILIPIKKEPSNHVS